MIVLLIGAMFAFVLILSYLNSPSHNDEVMPFANAAEIEQSSNQESSGADFGENIGDREPESAVEQSSGTWFDQQSEFSNCTPLGNPSELMLLRTKYAVSFEDITVHSTYQFDSFTGQYYRIKSTVTSNYGGRHTEIAIYYTYASDGKCVQYQTDLQGFGSFQQSNNNVMSCSGYPVWFVCKEHLDAESFDRYETYNAGGRKFNASVFIYANGEEELWVDESIPIMLRHIVYDDNKNKKFDVELLEVGGS